MKATSKSAALSVSAYANAIKLATKGVGGALIEGEAEKPRPTTGGAFVFELTDGKSRLVCQVPPWTLRRGITHKPAKGDLVRIDAAYPDFWPEGGRLSVVVDDVELAGEGELLKRRLAIIKRLEAEGLTDASQFPPLPRFPRAVGVIAGTDSDALRDVIQGLADRFPPARVFTACCQVQGAKAPAALISALDKLDLHPLVDVIIVARGGGSVRDLAAFDDEGLCRAIRAIETPVITAIGHTDNNPVSNRVTHAAYVPRHAAERVVPDRAALLAELDEADAAIGRACAGLHRQFENFNTHCLALRGRAKVKALQRDVSERGRELDSRTSAFLVQSRAALGEAREALAATPAHLLARMARNQRGLDQFGQAAASAGARPHQWADELDQLGQRMSKAGHRILRERRTNWLRALDRQGQSLAQAARRGVGRRHADLERDNRELSQAGRRRLRGLGREVDHLVAVLSASDYRKRGWILATDQSGRAITSIRDVKAHDRLRLHVRDGAIDATANQLHPATKRRNG